MNKILIVSILAVILLSSSIATSYANADTGKKKITDSNAKEIKNSDKKSLESSDDDQIKTHLGLQPNEKRVIVIYKDNVKKIDKDKLEKKGGKIKKNLVNLNGVVVQVDQSKIKEIESDPNVAQVIEDTLVHASLSVSILQIGANLVHSLGITGKNVKVCVVDSGIDDTHPALNPLVAEIDFVNSDNDATDDHGHGTHVAGIIASRDALYKGVAPDASLMAAKVLNSTGIGWTSDVINGINWCVSHGADVINLSVGGSTLYPSACDSNLDAQAVNNAVNQGVVVAVAAGNSGSISGISSPGCASKAITVGAINQIDGRTSFSNEGTELDVVAPGVLVTSLNAPIKGGGFVAKTGTSMATPHVAGLAALLLEKNPNLLPQQVRSTIQNTALDLGASGLDTIYGNGRIRANNALLATAPASVLIPSVTGAGNVQFSTNNGGMTSFSAIAESTLPSIGKPTMSFPFGFFTYTVTGIAPGSSAIITITYPSNIPTGTQFWKVNAGTWTNISSLVSSNNGDQTIVLTIQDGQLGDADGIINGQIIDPIGGGQLISPKISINDVTVAEGNSGITSSTFTVSLSSASSSTTTVNFATSDGSATTTNNDYIPNIGTLSFAPGETSKIITIQVIGDATIESDETFDLMLSGATNSSILDGTGVGIILNDDAALPIPATIYCGKTIDQFTSVINGDTNNNVIVGTIGDDLINGFGGDDRIWSIGGNDCIFGGEGNDYLVGGDGNDEINGENGNDKIWGQLGMDKLYGSFGDDRLSGGADNDSIFGEDGNDKIWGQLGDDIIDGGNEIDVCSGGIGANTIVMCE